MTARTPWVRVSGNVAAAMLGNVNIAQFAHESAAENFRRAVALCQSWPEWNGEPIRVERSCAS